MKARRTNRAEALLASRASILEAAERVFARDGLNGCRMHEIAVEANVSQALLHYHFGTKENLFGEVFAGRASEINKQRVEKLGDLFAHNATPALSQLLDALFRPTVELGFDTVRPGNYFARILASTANSDQPQMKELISNHYDEIAYLFIDALERVVDGISREDAVWAYMFSIGVGMTMMARTGRTSRLSGGLCDDSDVEILLQKIKTFVSGGLGAMAATSAV